MQPLMQPRCNGNIKINLWEWAGPLAWSARLSGIRPNSPKWRGSHLTSNTVYEDILIFPASSVVEYFVRCEDGEWIKANELSFNRECTNRSRQSQSRADFLQPSHVRVEMRPLPSSSCSRKNISTHVSTQGLATKKKCKSQFAD